MSYNPNWPRWVQASVADHFKTVCIAKGYPALVEGIDERTTEFYDAPNRIEIRMNGPQIQEWNKGYFEFEVDVNILIFSYMGGKNVNAYDGTVMAGVMAEAADQKIPVYKYGIGVDDDQSLIGCLSLQTTGRDQGINVHHFGEIDKENRLRQFGVDVSLQMTLCI